MLFETGRSRPELAQQAYVNAVDRYVNFRADLRTRKQLSEICAGAKCICGLRDIPKMKG